MQSQNTISVAFCLWIHRYTCVFSHNQSTEKGLDFLVVLRSTFHDELTYCQQITCFIVSTPMCCFLLEQWHTLCIILLFFFVSSRKLPIFDTTIFLCCMTATTKKSSLFYNKTSKVFFIFDVKKRDKKSSAGCKMWFCLWVVQKPLGGRNWKWLFKPITQ